MNDLNQPLLVLGTGGTIVGKAPRGRQGTYTSGSMDIRTLIESAGITAYGREIRSENLAAVGSQDMSEDIWMRLHARIKQAVSAEGVCAVIVTHGTDTLEEMAFVLDRFSTSFKFLSCGTLCVPQTS